MSQSDVCRGFTSYRPLHDCESSLARKVTVESMGRRFKPRYLSVTNAKKQNRKLACLVFTNACCIKKSKGILCIHRLILTQRFTVFREYSWEYRKLCFLALYSSIHIWYQDTVKSVIVCNHRNLYFRARTSLRVDTNPVLRTVSVSPRRRLFTFCSSIWANLWRNIPAR